MRKKVIRYKGYDFSGFVDKNDKVVYWCWNCKCYKPKEEMSSREICKNCYKPTINFIGYNLKSLKKEKDKRSQAIAELKEEHIKSIKEEREKWKKGLILLGLTKDGERYYEGIDIFEKFIKKKLRKRKYLLKMEIKKLLKDFGICGGITSSILITHVFYKLTFEVKRYTVVCPYGEAPYELVISLFALLGLILLFIDFIKD